MPILCLRHLDMSVGVFITVQPVLELVIVLLNQRIRLIQDRCVQQPLWILLLKRPHHDVPAFFNDRTIGKPQNGHGAFWAYRQHLRRLVLQGYFPQLYLQTREQHSQAGPHGIGAATKGIQTIQ